MAATATALTATTATPRPKKPRANHLPHMDPADVAGPGEPLTCICGNPATWTDVSRRNSPGGRDNAMRRPAFCSAECKAACVRECLERLEGVIL